MTKILYIGTDYGKFSQSKISDLKKSESKINIAQRKLYTKIELNHVAWVFMQHYLVTPPIMDFSAVYISDRAINISNLKEVIRVANTLAPNGIVKIVSEQFLETVF